VTYYIMKVFTTTLLIIAISELSKRSTFVGALLASLPLVSVLAMLWLYAETKDVPRVSALSTSIFWLVLPSLTLFIVLPMLLKTGVNFYFSMSIGVALTILSYGLLVTLLRYYGVKL